MNVADYQLLHSLTTEVVVLHEDHMTARQRDVLLTNTFGLDFRFHFVADPQRKAVSLHCCIPLTWVTFRVASHHCPLVLACQLQLGHKTPSTAAMLP